MSRISKEEKKAIRRARSLAHIIIEERNKAVEPEGEQLSSVDVGEFVAKLDENRLEQKRADLKAKTADKRSRAKNRWNRFSGTSSSTGARGL